MTQQKQRDAAAPQALSIRDAVGILGISRSTFYRLVSEGYIKPLKIRSRTVVMLSEIHRYLSSCSTKVARP
jgi:excisionase family DNA binding protein